MNKKYYFIFAIIILLSVILVSGGKSRAQMAMAPYVDIEATVVSVSLDESGNYAEGEELSNAPSDSAVVRIDNIIQTGGSPFDWSSLGIEKGKEVPLNFKYTVRPTKIITGEGETTRSGNVVAHTPMPAKISVEDHRFVFREDGSTATETILPGLKEGSRFKTKLWYTFELKVGTYEIIE